MELKQKHKLLLNTFIKNKTLSISEIEECLNIKTRSVYLYIDELNHFLKANNFNPITKFLNYGFTLDVDFNLLNNFLISNNMYFYNSNERVELIIINAIICKKITLSIVADKFKMDIKTTRNDFNKAIEFLKGNQIDAVYKDNNFEIINDKNNELNIRGLLASIINKKGAYIDKLKDINLTNSINQLLIKIQSILKVDWTVNFVDFLNLFIQLFILRIKNHSPNIISENHLNLTCQNELQEILIEFFKTQNININQNDINYLILLTMCGNIVNVQPIITIYPYQLIGDGINKFIDSFEKNAYLNIENKNELTNDLSKHLIPVYYRLKLKMDSFLQRIDDIENKYKEYFLIAKKNIHYIEENINIKLNDNEISYLILHIISGVYTTIKKRKIQVGLFCNHPNGIYKMMENELYKKLNDISITKLVVNQNTTLDQLKCFDLLISTSYLDNSLTNIIYINKFISDNDIEKIRNKIKEINKDIFEYINYLEIKDYKNIDDIIDVLTNNLVEIGLINNSYIDGLKTNLKNNFNNMLVNQNTLVLHYNPSVGVLKKGYAINLGILNKELKINNNKIKYFMVVVPYHKLNHLKPISKLIDVIIDNKKDNDTINKLKAIIDNEFKK